MTREDAIKELRELRKIGEIMTNEHYKAIDMAIKALEQCEVWNGIHGQVVAPKGTFDKIWEDADKAEQEQQTDIRDKRVNDELNRVKDELEQEPKTGWIPIGYELPKEEGHYLTTNMYHNVYYDYWNGERFERTETIIAWQPLPKPYSEVEQ